MTRHTQRLDVAVVVRAALSQRNDVIPDGRQAAQPLPRTLTAQRLIAQQAMALLLQLAPAGALHFGPVLPHRPRMLRTAPAAIGDEDATHGAGLRR
jgi:hypothetical protein